MVVTQSTTLQHEVVDAIGKRLAARASDLYVLTSSTGSFEDWVNWEAYIACKSNPEWYCIAKPTYRDFEVTDSRYVNALGDLAVMRKEPHGERWVFAEFALLHDGNINGKWREKIANDIEKIRSVPFENDIRLLFVVASSHRDICRDPKWAQHLAAIPIWNEVASLHGSFPLNPSGTFVLKAFQISNP